MASGISWLPNMPVLQAQRQLSDKKKASNADNHQTRPEHDKHRVLPLLSGCSSARRFIQFQIDDRLWGAEKVTRAGKVVGMGALFRGFVPAALRE